MIKLQHVILPLLTKASTIPVIFSKDTVLEYISSSQDFLKQLDINYRGKEL